MKRLPLAAVLGLACLLGSAAVPAQSVRIVSWVENAPASDTSKIALGYPVPIPVDTPLPFAGFRSYAGLHLRHQDLEATTTWVHGSVVGNTLMHRDIWAYRLGDENTQTVYGLPEQAMLSNGGIHAREWQSPEVATGIIERLALGESDAHLLDYLRDNANIIVIPVLNVDGFLQTQRYPSTNWLGADLTDPVNWPRDGRMRRKNMLQADEVLETQGDHLNGVDLNRNNAPFWATSQSSSGDLRALTHHGTAPASEPETQALDAAAQLGPADRLSMYTDIHSYSQVHFWSRTFNERLTRLTDRLLSTFTNHHREYPAGKFYYFDRWWQMPIGGGIGTTEEYFTNVYRVPAWTLEIEPSGGQHQGLPGIGADYGGLGRNGHDGFILPDSEVERVRTQLAETFTVAYYQQAGPPSLKALRLVDEATGAVVFEAEWDVLGPTERRLHRYQPRPLGFDRDYRAWMAWDKPMRWREAGAVAALPGKSAALLNVERSLEAGETALNVELGEPQWLAQAGGAPLGYARYRDDALNFTLRIPSDEANRAAILANPAVTLGLFSRDMVGFGSDADPATVVRWGGGAWQGYEDTTGATDTDNGGMDKTIRFDLSATPPEEPFVIRPGTTAAWRDTERSGEGFVIEILAGNRAVAYWFTYDDEGGQDWYIAVGEVRGNRALFPRLLRVSGGEFGPGFDPEAVMRTPVGSASFTWSSCNEGVMHWVLDADGVPFRQGRMNLSRLTRVAGLECTDPGEPATSAATAETTRYSGSWYDPSHSGEGYVLEVLDDGRVLTYWFSFDTAGKRRWFYATGEIEGGRLVFDEMLTTSGAKFGDAFNEGDVVLQPWGSLVFELGCDGGIAQFEPTEEGFPAGSLDLIRLTLPDGLACGE